MRTSGQLPIVFIWLHCQNSLLCVVLILRRENKKALLTEFPGSRTPGLWPCLGCGQGLLREVGVDSTGEAGPDARLEGGALLPSAEPQACEFQPGHLWCLLPWPQQVLSYCSCVLCSPKCVNGAVALTCLERTLASGRHSFARL